MPLKSRHQDAIIRDGHKSFSRTIGDALDESARLDVEHAWLRDMLEDMATGRRRNQEHGGSCDNCGKDAFLASTQVAEVTFDLCRGCRKLDARELMAA